MVIFLYKKTWTFVIRTFYCDYIMHHTWCVSFEWMRYNIIITEIGYIVLIPAFTYIVDTTLNDYNGS